MRPYLLLASFSLALIACAPDTTSGTDADTHTDPTGTAEPTGTEPTGTTGTTDPTGTTEPSTAPPVAAEYTFDCGTAVVGDGTYGSDWGVTLPLHFAGTVVTWYDEDPDFDAYAAGHEGGILIQDPDYDSYRSSTVEITPDGTVRGTCTWETAKGPTPYRWRFQTLVVVGA